MNASVYYKSVLVPTEDYIFIFSVSCAGYIHAHSVIPSQLNCGGVGIGIGIGISKMLWNDDTLSQRFPFRHIRIYKLCKTIYNYHYKYIRCTVILEYLRKQGRGGNPRLDSEAKM